MISLDGLTESKIEYLSTIEYLCDNDYNVFRMGMVI